MYFKRITKYCDFKTCENFNPEIFVGYHVVYSRGYYDSVHHGLQMCTEDSENICQFYRATRKGLFFVVGKYLHPKNLQVSRLC